MRARIFKPLDEAINLGLPLLIIVLAAIEIFFSVTIWSGFAGNLYEDLFVDLVLLNLTHTAFTYVLLIGLPEFEPWLVDQGVGHKNRFWWRLFLLNVFLTVMH